MRRPLDPSEPDDPFRFAEAPTWLADLWTETRNYLRRKPVEGALFALLLGAVLALLARRPR